jgi:hypothetical protein
MARRRYAPRRRYSPRRWFGKRRRRGSRRIPLAPVLGLAGTVLGGKNESTLSLIQGGNWQGAFNRVCINMTGYDPATGGWDWKLMNWEPTIAGLLVHMTIGKLVNKHIRKIPYVNI